MSTSRLYLTTALVLSLSAGLAPVAFAQNTAPAASEQPTEIVVTGQRASRRTRLDTLAPVDIVTSQSLAAQGNSELAQGLSRVAPSLNFPRPSATDGTDNIRPAQLRGLSPDETLVLVNGKRWHSSALVNINGSAGRGSAAVDLNSIPEAALDRAEVLRDGASAQYGSDAIAGVVNLRLRQADHGGGVTVSYGQYDTDIKAANSERYAHDGATSDISGWAGFKLGSDGFLTVSADLKHRDPTSRGDIDSTVTPATVTSRYGDPEQDIASVFLNAGKPLNDIWSWYGNAGYTSNDSESAAFFRHAGVSAQYPNGFLPIINAKSKDYAATFGVKGAIGQWASDFSLTYGSNTLDYYTLNSVNTSLTDSQTSFYDGQLKYGQTAFNADFSRPFEVGLSSPLTLAFGLEGRHETYQIKAGDEASYTGSGAQGFSGFSPTNVVDESRDNIGLYIDAAGNFTEKLSYDAALRYENYSDFGSNTSGKLALRYDFTPSFALRGTLNNGFRAPSLQQEYFTSIASVVTDGQVIETGTFPATSAVAQTLGAKALEPETSTSESLGAVWHKGRFELTVDGYNIRIGNRIVLSENISNSATSGYYSADLAALLASQNVSSARFFLNGVTTTTTGVDIVANYRIPTETYGNFNLSFAWNNNNTVINNYPSTNVLSSLSPAPPLFARIRQYILTNSSPENKGTFAVDWTRSQLSVTARATYYGDVIDAASVAANDIHTGDKTLFDLSGSYRFSTGTTLMLGADNLFDVYPDKTPARLNTTSGNGVGALAFTRFSPFGFNGRYLYAKVSQSW
ncbi:MAG: TonB-dependent receptor [Asticcacaulis sp.]|uniref:TonB-dependent receptor plug domain-containing protein n=1 Tax=Asticcacaulis sp. TaxID=1872648 RepID=UPI0039E331C7